MNAFFSAVSRLADHLGPKLLLALALTIALTLLIGIYLGRVSVYSALKVGPETAQSMLSELSDLREALRVARGDLEVQRTRHAVDLGSGLSLRKPELVPAATPGRFRYRFFVQQIEREYDMVEGSLSVDVSGFNGKQEVTYPLSELSKDFDDKASTLHFRYFQAIEGELVLPLGFEPKGITLVARASKPRKSKAKKQFPWELQERFINVGK